MSIASEITRISGNIADAYTSLNAKGATMPQDQNSNNLADTIDSIPAGGGGGQTVWRGDWIVPQVYLDLDDTTKEYYTTYNPTCAVGIYLDKDKLGNNPYSYSHSSIGANNYRVFSKNGELTKSTASFSSYWTSVTLDSDEDWLVILCTANGMGFEELSTSFVNSNISANDNIAKTPVRKATKYIAYCGELTSSSISVNTAIWSNLDEIHPVSPYILRANSNFLNSGNGFKYIPSTTECTYISLPNISNVIKNISLLPNLPDGADFSSQTTAWDFSLDINSFDYYSKFINLSRMYITLPNANVTFNGSMSNPNTQGIHLTPENWAYIAEHAPTVSSKTIKIDKYNEDALGSTNKATLQSKGWTVTVLTS